MYNKNNLAVAKVAAKETAFRAELGCVAFFGDRTVATDSFKLIEMSATGQRRETPSLHFAKEISKIKVKKGEEIGLPDLLKALAPLHGDKYPLVDPLFKRSKGVTYAEVVVNAQYLADICAVLKELDPFQAVTIKIAINAVREPLIIEANDKKSGGTQRARALLMPMA